MQKTLIFCALYSSVTYTSSYDHNGLSTETTPMEKASSAFAHIKITTGQMNETITADLITAE